MSSVPPLALFGGTFDPVHRAHIEGALAVSKVLGGATVRLIPNAVPPHRPQPRATAQQRLAMLELACQDWPELEVDDIELRRPQPSYSIDTLRHFRALIGQRPLIFILGADSFASLDSWHNWREFATLCHLVVLPRPGAAEASTQVCQAFAASDSKGLLSHPAGLRLMLTQPWLDLSATAIRDTLARGERCERLPASVREYIEQQHLYQ